MPPETKDGANASAPPAPADEIKNIKSEFDRKLGNIQDNLKKSNETLLAQFQTMLSQQKATPKAQASDDDDGDLENLFYKNPKLALKKVKEEAKNELKTEFSAQAREAEQRNTVIAQLYKDFPELSDDEHEFTKLAIQKQQEMAPQYGNSPAAFKAAVAEAALELGLKPKKKRTDDDTYNVSGKGSSSNRPAKKKDEELSPETVEMAKLLGVDPERVKKRVSGRRNFTKWE